MGLKSNRIQSKSCQQKETEWLRLYAAHESWIFRCLFGVRFDPLPLLPDDASLLGLHEGVVVRALDVVGLLLTLGADPVVGGIGNVAELAGVILDDSAVGLGVDVLAVVGAGQSQDQAQNQAAKESG